MVTELAFQMHPRARAAADRLPSHPWVVPHEPWRPCVVWPMHDAAYMAIGMETLEW